MNRTMIDGLGINAAAMHAKMPNPDLVAVYDTGTPNILWTPQERSLFQGITQVTIDQGYRSPVITRSIVRDVEPGAWLPADAVGLGNWRAERPTVYCDRTDLQEVISLGWRRDVWLAWPGYTAPTAPNLGPVNIVAVQNTNSAIPELSTVYDPYWPYTAPERDHMISGRVIYGEPAFTPFPSGSFSRIQVYRDFISEKNPVKVRVAMHSESKGYLVSHVTLSGPAPVTAPFSEPDIDAVSVEIVDSVYCVGYTLS